MRENSSWAAENLACSPSRLRERGIFTKRMRAMRDPFNTSLLIVTTREAVDGY